MASIIVETDEDKDKKGTKESGLVTWVMSHVDEWENYKDINYKEKWEEYYRLWRGIWDASDKARESERSKLISPALQQAIEMAVAELEEATFGKGKWFDVADNVEDPDKQDMAVFRQLLLEDLNLDGVPAAMSEVFLNSALYGTGIGKMVVEEEDVYTVGSQKVQEGSSVMEGVGELSSRIAVQLISVPPEEFVIDTAAKNIKEALGMAQIMNVPKHTVTSKQESGMYYDDDLGGFPDDIDVSAKGESKTSETENQVRIVEYHGLIPRRFLDIDLGEDEELADLGLDEEDEVFEDDDLVEAIVTIANDGILLRVVENPFMMKDRCFLAFQYDTIPNRFWGRGVAEKGYNMQKAIDAELRARMDAMALTIHPMMAADATRLPRGFDLSVRAGRNILTQGDPNTILRPLTFGSIDSSTFTQSGDLERQLQNATGSMDAGTPTGMNARNSTASGMSMIQGGAIKRSKRTMANIERHFTSPLVHKAAWRRIQFDSTRYPVKDVKFTVFGTLGIMARELEQQQLSSLLNTVPPDSPAYWMLIRSIYENSSITSKDQMLQLVDQLLEKTLNPEPDPMVQIKQQELQILAKDKTMSLQIEKGRADTERARVKIEAELLPYNQAVKEAKAMLDVASAESKEVGDQLSAYELQIAEIREREDGQRDSDLLRKPSGDVPE